MGKILIFYKYGNTQKAQRRRYGMPLGFFPCQNRPLLQPLHFFKEFFYGGCPCCFIYCSRLTGSWDPLKKQKGKRRQMPALSHKLCVLSKQGQYALCGLVCLCKHGLACLRKDVVFAVFHHLLCHVCIADAGFCCRSVLNNIIQVGNGVL